jgi:hypothetical protein
MIGLRKEIRVTTTKTGNIDNKINQNYGGYAAYFELYPKLVRMAIANKSLFTKWQHFKSMTTIYLGFIWWCIFKPLGQFYSTTTRFSGSYKKLMEDNLVVSHTIAKEKTFKLFNIPFYYYATSFLTEEEIKALEL